jgi:iron complex outermembrane receptor protein
MFHTDRIVAIAVAIALSSSTALAQHKPDLGTATLQELMGMSVHPVFGASLRLQPVTQAPASVTIITADDIRRFGYRSLADILGGVGGFYVSDDRNYQDLGVRGFSRPGDFNSRILLLIDGHRSNDGIYDQAMIGADLGLDPALFERVEVIRGPGSSLYGTSAFFAVVNIIMKTAATADPLSVWLEGGSQRTTRGGVSMGRVLGNGVGFALSASGHRSAGTPRLYFPEFDSEDTNNGIVENAERVRAGQLCANLSVRHWKLTAAVSSRLRYVQTAAFESTVGDDRVSSTDTRAFTDPQYERAAGASQISARTYVDYARYFGISPYPDAPLSRDGTTAVWWGAEGRVTRPLQGRQTVTVGGEFRHNVQQDQRGAFDGEPEDLHIDQSSRVVAVYAHDEVTLHDRLRLVAGARFDDYAGFSRLTPRAGIIYNHSANGAIKYLFGSAFRAPNAYELDYFTNGVRTTVIGPERINTHEFVWEQYSSDWLRTSVSAYWSDANDLITLTSIAPGPTSSPVGDLSFRNVGRTRAKGLAFEGEIRLHNGVQAFGAHTIQRSTDYQTRAELTNAPRHLTKVRLSVPGPWAGSFVALETRAMSGRRTLAGTMLDGFVLAHLRGEVPLGTQLRLEGSVRNLFDVSYDDPASEEHRQISIPQNGRTAFVGVRWMLGRK